MSSRTTTRRVTELPRYLRPAYEAVACVAWFLGALIYIAVIRLSDSGISIVGYAAIPMFLCAFYYASEVWRNWYSKALLTIPKAPWISVDNVLAKQLASGMTFIGKGFDWEPVHARVMRKIVTMNSVDELQPPPIFRRAMSLFGRSAGKILLEGKHYIHGSGIVENDLFVTDLSRRSHTLVLGTNGAGKTRLLETLVAQSIARGRPTNSVQKRFEAQNSHYIPGEGAENKTIRIQSLRPKYGPVFILDPKGDRDLRDRAFATAKMLGRETDFKYFSPTDHMFSFRINPLAKFNRKTELANRLSALLPTGGDSEAFRQFAWRAINVVVEGLWFAGIHIDLRTLKQHIQGGIQELAVLCIEKHIDNNRSDFPNWQATLKDLGGRRSVGGDIDTDIGARAVALSTYYVNYMRSTHPNSAIEGIVDVVEHDRQHYDKLIGNLIPILVQLTSDPLGILLSGVDSGQDGRNFFSFQTMIDKNYIVYVNFESLADSVVGSALGSLFLADLTACAAVRHHRGITDPPVSVYVDEAAEMMNDPFIQALNKGRAAGFELTLASQTVADFVARMGNEAKAMQVLGNVNTTIAMRLQDNESAQFIADKFAETNYDEKSSSKSATTIAPAAMRGRDYSGSVTKNTQSSDLSLVTPDLLSSLPPGHFFGHFPGGRKVKGRVLMMPMSDDDRFDPSVHGHQASSHQVTVLERRPENSPATLSAQESAQLHRMVSPNPSRDASNLPDPTTGASPSSAPPLVVSSL